jgi:glycosyltransferase involved in cell wall biosynthesis
MKRIGIDAHVITGKFQGSRTFLLNVLTQIGAQDRENRYILYSFDPVETRALLDFPNFEHKLLAVKPAIPRLLLYWPWVQLRDRLDYLLTQYISPLLFGRRQLVVIHDILFETHPQYFQRLFVLRFRLLTRLSARRSAAVFTVSSDSRRALMEHYGIPSGKIRLTPNAFPAPVTEHQVLPEVMALKPYILFVGRLEPRKNIPTLIKAFAALEDETLNLVIVGGVDFHSCNVLDAINAHPRIHHFDRVSDAQLSTFYRNARLFVYPSYAEGFGLPVLEALSYAVPVITSNTTALPEVGGDVVDYFDPCAGDAVAVLSTAIKAALARDSVDATILKAHLARFSWAASAATVIDTINSL